MFCLMGFIHFDGIGEKLCAEHMDHELNSSEQVHPYQLEQSISSFRVVWCTFIFLIFF